MISRTLFVVMVLSFTLQFSSGTYAQEKSRPESDLSFRLSDQVFEPVRTNRIGIADLDGDGDLDAIFANMGFNNSQVWFNDGNGRFIESGQKLTQQGHGTGIGDFDGDGDIDVFIPCAGWSQDNGQTWSYIPSKVYFNNG